MVLRIRGGVAPLSFNSLSNNIQKDVVKGNSTPHLRITKGLNLTGKCSNPECKYKDKEVVI